MLRLFVLSFLLFGCGLSEERYRELRQHEECRIFGPSCTGDYSSVESCLGDVASSVSSADFEAYQPQQ